MSEQKTTIHGANDHHAPAGETHRCSGCGHRWPGGPALPGEWTGAELCGDCWRKTQPVLHAPAGETARELADIQDRAEACEQYYMSPLGEVVIKRDVPRLLAEIKRLSAAREGLAALVDQAAKALSRVSYWQHYVQCNPLSRDGCKCGLWEAKHCADALAAWLTAQGDPGESRG